MQFIKKKKKKKNRPEPEHIIVSEKSGGWGGLSPPSPSPYLHPCTVVDNDFAKNTLV